MEEPDQELSELNAVYGSLDRFFVDIDSRMSEQQYQALLKALYDGGIDRTWRRPSPSSKPVAVPAAMKQVSGYVGPELAHIVLTFTVTGFTMFAAGFLGEAGKDIYAWLKSKAALLDAQKNGAFHISYQFNVGSVRIYDGPRLLDHSPDKPSTKVRHDEFLIAVEKISVDLSDAEKESNLAIELQFDEETSQYVLAVLLVEDGGQLKTPIREIDLVVIDNPQ